MANRQAPASDRGNKNHLTMTKIMLDLTALEKNAGPVQDLLEKLSGPNADKYERKLKLLLRDEENKEEPARGWMEKDGIIYFHLTSDGTTGKQWIKRLEKKGFRIGDYAKSILLSPDFKPTSGVINEIAVIRGSAFSDSDRITKNIRAYAAERKLTAPNAEVACLIREALTDEDIEKMGLWWIVAMHEPIKDSDGDPRLLYADRYDDGRWLRTCWDDPDGQWTRDDGFAFVASQIQSSGLNHP